MPTHDVIAVFPLTADEEEEEEEDDNNYYPWSEVQHTHNRSINTHPVFQGGSNIYLLNVFINLFIVVRSSTLIPTV